MHQYKEYFVQIIETLLRLLYCHTPSSTINTNLLFIDLTSYQDALLRSCEQLQLCVVYFSYLCYRIYFCCCTGVVVDDVLQSICNIQ